MPRVTVKEFVKGVGLDDGDYVNGSVFLKILERRGLAKAVAGGRREHPRGRPVIVYDVSDAAYELLGGTVPDAAHETPKGTVVVEAKSSGTVAPEVPVVPVAESQYVWGDEDED
jgi:hypothetical protein